MEFKDNGFLFDDNSKYHLINDNDIEILIKLNNEELLWQQRVRNYIDNRDNLNIKYDFLIDELHFMNTRGVNRITPFNQIILSFDSTRHFFRGENKKYKSSLPSLRRILGKNKRKNELVNAVETLKTYNFMNFIWNFDIVRFWYLNYSDINFKALAQHYGFNTNLLDLTNNFLVALFFAVCKYDKKTDKYLPLEEEDINKDEESKYGVIFHSPNWVIDFYNGTNMMEYYSKINNFNSFFDIDSGLFDGYAFQIGYQPLMRCKQQYGYIFPLRYGEPLNKNNKFEKLYFKHSVSLSKKVYEMMNYGKAVFPYEGINCAKKYINEIKKSYTFNINDVKDVYNTVVDKSIFTSFDSFEKTLLFTKFNDNKISIINEDVVYSIDNKVIKKINNYYSKLNILEEIDNKQYMKPEIREIFIKRQKND